MAGEGKLRLQAEIPAQARAQLLAQFRPQRLGRAPLLGAGPLALNNGPLTRPPGLRMRQALRRLRRGVGQHQQRPNQVAPGRRRSPIDGRA